MLRAGLRGLLRPAQDPRVPVAVQRRWTALLAKANRIPKGTSVEPVTLGGVPGELVEHTGGADVDGTVLYLHGGAYVISSPRVERVITASLARHTGLPVYSLDYRLAPEHPFPAGLEDAIAAYRELVGGADGGTIAIAGDSAGAGLALSTALAAPGQGLPSPAALALICPWLDLTQSGPSIVANARRDPMLKRSWLDDCARMYRATAPADDPRCSPLFADLSGLPPVLVHAAADDILLSDAERFAERAAAAGADVELQRFDGLWHDFHLHAGALPSADAAFERLGSFLKRTLC